VVCKFTNTALRGNTTPNTESGLLGALWTTDSCYALHRQPVGSPNQQRYPPITLPSCVGRGAKRDIFDKLFTKFSLLWPLHQPQTFNDFYYFHTLDVLPHYTYFYFFDLPKNGAFFQTLLLSHTQMLISIGSVGDIQFTNLNNWLILFSYCLLTYHIHLNCFERSNLNKILRLIWGKDES
jgi:hypothetical protein